MNCIWKDTKTVRWPIQSREHCKLTMKQATGLPFKSPAENFHRPSWRIVKVCQRNWWKQHDFLKELWILGTSQLCKDLDRFCTSELMSHLCSTHPMFSFGKYEVTAFCYRHFFLKSKRTQVPPIFIGPTALHHSKSNKPSRRLSMRSRLPLRVLCKMPRTLLQTVKLRYMKN